MKILDWKVNQGKCGTPYCRNEKAPGRKICHKCRARRQAISNPVGYAYNNLKQNAKRRGKYFDLTLEEFTEFCRSTDYIDKKGKSRKSYSIDRIDNSKGYTISNIQILTLSENSKKSDNLPF